MSKPPAASPAKTSRDGAGRRPPELSPSPLTKIEILPTSHFPGRTALPAAPCSGRDILRRPSGRRDSEARLSHRPTPQVAIGGQGQLSSSRRATARRRSPRPYMATAAAVPVSVRFDSIPSAWSFRNDVLPVMTKMGCNSGPCHGAAAGKNGFKLTLRGYDPETDYFTLTHQALARRTERMEPAKSLILLKPTLPFPTAAESASRWTHPSIRSFPAGLRRACPLPRILTRA